MKRLALITTMALFVSLMFASSALALSISAWGEVTSNRTKVVVKIATPTGVDAVRASYCPNGLSGAANADCSGRTNTKKTTFVRYETKGGKRYMLWRATFSVPRKSHYEGYATAKNGNSSKTDSWSAE